MATALTNKDWSDTPLGPIGRWPDRLKAAVDLVLGSQQAMLVLWGGELVQIYNGAFSALMGNRHPRELGLATRRCWPAIWEIGRPVYDDVLAGHSCVCRDCEIATQDSSELLLYDLNYCPLRVDQGDVRGILVTIGKAESSFAHEAAQEIASLRGRIEEQVRWIADIQRQMRNMLSGVRSIIRRTAATSKDLEGMEMHLQGRIGAFARAQTTIARARSGRGVILADLIDDELAVHLGREGETVTLKGPDIELLPRAAELLGLAMHELASNAVKFGALSQSDGRILVRWQREENRSGSSLVLEWEENGCRLDPDAMGEAGFGTEMLLHSLAYELDARTRLQPTRTGMHFKLEMPLDGMEANCVPFGN
ncbi:sensor histidine kinase [Novosphingobium sp. BL-8A]|uniref:sensor histidine kinase n=1 Tax=Novosphingobium sp. BL-8A TaxID=3127639 RepID=UPI003756B3A7